MECYVYLRKVTGLLSDGKTSYERRFGQPIKGLIVPFGSLVEYHPYFWERPVKNPSIWVSRIRFVRGGEIWKGDALVADIEELETMDASENLLEKTQCERGDFSKKNENLFFQSQMDEPKPLEEIKIWEHPPWYGSDPFKKRVMLTFLGESEGSLPQSQDSFPDVGEAINDFWSMSGHFTYRHHVEPRVTVYSPREESFPIPLKIHWCIQNFSYEFGCQAREKPSKIAGISMGYETCQILGQVSLDLFYWKKNLQTDICGPGRD